MCPKNDKIMVRSTQETLKAIFFLGIFFLLDNPLSFSLGSCRRSQARGCWQRWQCLGLDALPGLRLLALHRLREAEPRLGGHGAPRRGQTSAPQTIALQNVPQVSQDNSVTADSLQADLYLRLSMKEIEELP